MLRRVLPWLTVVIVVGVVYDGYIFYSRWSANQSALREQKAKEVAHARAVLDLMGGDSLKILTFYSVPPIVRAGQQASICYGVNGAKTVQLVPPVEEVWPAQSHCLQVSPRRDTEYKLIAEDGAGHSVEQSFVLKVK
jgi:hypothetical protein